MVGTSFTEKDIKRALDGTFTRLGADGKVVTAGRLERAAAGQPEVRAGADWTAEEDQLLINLKNSDWKAHQIAVHLNRTKSAVDIRTWALRKAGRIA